MKKQHFYTMLFLTLLCVGCGSDKKDAKDLLTLVPKKTAAIVRINDYHQFKDKLNDNSFLQANKDLPFFNFFDTLDRRLTNLNLSGKSLVCFTTVGQHIRSTLITTDRPNISDSLKVKGSSTYQYNTTEVKQFKIDSKTYYAVQLQGLYVFGDSKLVVENIIRLSNENVELSEEFQKIYKASSGNNALFINPSEFQKAYDLILPHSSSGFFDKLGDWIALDLDLKESKLAFNGITTPQKDQSLGVLIQQNPGLNKIAEITPLGADGFYSFTYDNYDLLKDNLSFFRKKDYPKLQYDLLDQIDEAGQIYMRNSSATILHSLDAQITKNEIEKQGKLVETHRNHQIYTFEAPNYFYNAYYPLLKTLNINYYAQVDDFFIFSKDLSTIEYIIASHQSKTVLSEDKAYLKSIQQLSDKSSILIVGINKNLKKVLSNAVENDYKKAYLDTDLADYNYTVAQFIQDKNYTYVNGLFMQIDKNEAKVRGGVQVQSIKPDEDIAAGPWFFINWKTKHYDIVLQGESNTLYGYDNKGHLLWKTSINGRIIGDIQSVDLFNNHRIQMAFVTPSTFYIVGRDGKIVKPFDKTFKHSITQPLAIFDYNHNGNFRFLITQDNEVHMFDKALKPVEGFEFSKTKSSITQAPKHFRIGTKDYIVIPEESGQLHILNPRGQTRVKVKRNIDFSDNQWYLYNDHFASTDKEGNLIQIDQKGGISVKKLGLSSSHKIDATAHTLVTFSDNRLTIKGKTVNLDYGLYTYPEIFYINNKIYVSITDKQAHKVYLFDSNAKLFSGFPVYGNSIIDLNNMDQHGSLEVLVRGEGDSVLIYEVR